MPGATHVWADCRTAAELFGCRHRPGRRLAKRDFEPERGPVTKAAFEANAASHQIHHGECRPFVGHVNHVQPARRRTEHFHGEVRAVAGAGRGIADLAGIGLGTLHQVLKGFDRRVRHHGQGQGVGGDGADPVEVVHRMKGQLLFHRWRHIVHQCERVREFDYHDTFLAADYSHPGDNIPPILAVAQQMGKTGKDFIRGAVAGYELHVDLVKAICLHKHKKDHIAPVFQV
mgnify:CR=1 FL=1